MDILQRLFYTKEDFQGLQIYMLLRIARVIGAGTASINDTREELIEKLCTKLEIK